MRRSVLAARGLTFGLAALTGASSAYAGSSDYVQSAEVGLSNVERNMSSVQDAMAHARGERLTVEQRMANGTYLFRNKDYEHASAVFTEIIEGFPDAPSIPDALWLRGETYYANHEYASARPDYQQILRRAGEPRFQPYIPRAVARVVDVSLRMHDTKGLDEVFQELSSGLAIFANDPNVQYAIGKAYYARGDFAHAAQAFAAVPSATPSGPQARYFQGLVQIKLDESTSAPGATPAVKVDYRRAIDLFKQATMLPADSEEHRRVIDLAWMAIGRLYYEMDLFQPAVGAYQRISHDSPEYGTMLYEVSWVYLRMGDIDHAVRYLELLALLDPTSPYVGDGTLLRADLLLRASAYDKALKLYEGVKTQFEPMLADVDGFLSKTTDVGVFYDRLVQRELDTSEGKDSLPPLAVRWARESQGGQLAFGVVDDLAQTRRLIADFDVLFARFNSLGTSAYRARMFPDLMAGEQRALGLVNQLARVRRDVAQALDEEEPGRLGGEMGQVRAERRQLMATIEKMPTTQVEFTLREDAEREQWNHVSQEVTNRAFEIDQLHAITNGLRRSVTEDPQHTPRDPAAARTWLSQLDSEDRELDHSSQQVGGLRQQIDAGRYRIGLGDVEYRADEAARGRFRDLVDREVELASAGAAGGGAQHVAANALGLLLRTRNLEDRLSGTITQLEQQATSGLAEMRAKVDAERAKIDEYTQRLHALDKEGRESVGRVAEENFRAVRGRLRSIVLRADVGTTEQAWQVREDKIERVRRLLQERVHTEQLLDDEMHQVLDDGEDEAKK